MISPSYRIYRIASWLRYQTPRHLTPAGLLTLITAALASLGSFDLDRSVAYQAFSLTFGLLVTSLAFKFFFRTPLTATRQLPRFASVGQPFQYRVEVRNAQPQTLRSLEWFEDLADPRPGRAEFKAWRKTVWPARSFRVTRRGHGATTDFRRATNSPVAIPTLAPHSTVEFSVEARPQRRGVLRFNGGSIGRPDPLGLIRAFHPIHLPDSVTVLPKRYPLPQIPQPGNRQYQPNGVALAAAIGESDEFISLRDYRPGDPLRHLHWRSWARIGRPIVREYQDEFIPRHALVLDTIVPPTETAAFEEAVSIAASFACTIDTQESLLDLLFVGPQAVSFTTGRGLGRADQALEILASVQPQPTTSFAALEHLVLRHARLVSGCVCVLVGWDEPRQAFVRRLRGLGLPVLALVVQTTSGRDPQTPPAPGSAGGQVHFLEPGRVAEGLARWSNHE